jgi:hypothetical protein
MKKQGITLLALLAFSVTVSAGLAFDDKKMSTSKDEIRLQKTGDKICSAIKIGCEKTAKALEKAGKKTKKTLESAAAKTNQALEKAEKKIQGKFHDKSNGSK